MIFLGIIFILFYSVRKNRENYISRNPDEFNDFEKMRMKIYTDNLTSKLNNKHIFKLEGQKHDFMKDYVIMDSDNILSLNNNKIWRRHNRTLNLDLKKLWKKYPELPKDKWLKIKVSDTDNIAWYKEPTITKSRFIDGNTDKKPYAILGRLRADRHFKDIKSVLDMEKTRSFKNKQIKKVIWRGQPAGIGCFGHGYMDELFPREFLSKKASRQTLMEKWYDTNTKEIDVGLTGNSISEKFKKYKKSDMRIRDMLDYKYILSVEGTDVSTSLKWNMASKSVVLMPHPTTESWFAESLLEPWVHYVPVENDFSDLLKKKKWCDEHIDMCEEIINNANEYVMNFINEEKEMYMFYCVLNIYFSLVEFDIKIMDTEI